MRRLGGPAAYAGAWSTWTAGLKNGGVGAARAEGPRTPSRLTARRAATMASGSDRRILNTRGVGARDMRVAPETEGFSAQDLIEIARFSKTGTTLLRQHWHCRGPRPKCSLGLARYGGGQILMGGAGEINAEGTRPIHRASADGPEVTTLAERLITSFRLPYTLGCIVLGFGVFGLFDIFL